MFFRRVLFQNSTPSISTCPECRTDRQGNNAEADDQAADRGPLHLSQLAGYFNKDIRNGSVPGRRAPQSAERACHDDNQKHRAQNRGAFFSKIILCLLCRQGD